MNVPSSLIDGFSFFIPTPAFRWYTFRGGDVLVQLFPQPGEREKREQREEERCGGHLEDRGCS